MRTPRTRGQWAVTVLLLLVMGGWWLWQQRDAAPEAGPVQPDRTAGTATLAPSGDSDAPATAHAGTDPESHLPWVEVEDLPAEAEETLGLIDDGGPFPYDEDDSVFGNFEGVLPPHERGYYHEYTVETPGLSHRGPRRIVTGDDDEFFWTSDHYQSFARIMR